MITSNFRYASGPLAINMADGNYYLSIEQAKGNITLTSGMGNNKLNFKSIVGDISINLQGPGEDQIKLLDIEGSIDIDSGSRTNDNFSIAQTHGDISLTSGEGATNTTIQDVEGNINIDLQGSGADEVHLFQVDGSVDIKTWDGNDIIMIGKLYGSLLIDLGAGNDMVSIDYLGGDGTVSGGPGNDTLQLDTRSDTSDNVTIADENNLEWNGGDGNNTVNIHFFPGGTTSLNLIGDDIDSNQVILRCTDEISIELKENPVTKFIKADTCAKLSSNAPSFSPTTVSAPVSQSPTSSSPSSSPNVASTVVLSIQSILEWNYTCSNIDQTTLIDVAKIIEKSFWDSMQTDLTESTLVYYVDNICDRTVGEHVGYPPGRRLQNDISQIQLTTEITTEGTAAEADSIFNDVNLLFNQIVQDGRLDGFVKSNSGGAIQATFSPVVNSTYTVKTKSPTILPSPLPTTAPISNPPITGSPVSTMLCITVKYFMLPQTNFRHLSFSPRSLALL